MRKHSIDKYVFICFLIFFILTYVLNLEHYSLWEKFQLYTVFGPNDLNFSLNYPLRGTLVGGYFFLDISRLFTYLIGLNEFSLKFLVKFYGFLSLIFFYFNCNYFTTRKISLVTTLLLFFNFNFFIFSNSFLIVIFVFLISNICFFLILSLINKYNLFKLILLNLLIFVIIYNYLSLRVLFGPIILFLYIFIILHSKNDIEFNKRFSQIILITLFLFTLTFLYDPNNFYRIIFLEFLFKEGTSEIKINLENFNSNIIILFKNLLSLKVNFGNIGEITSYNKYYNFNFFNFFILFFVFLLGLFNFIKDKNHFVLFFFLIISILPFLFSIQFFYNENKYSTLSIYRIFLSYTPIYIIIAIGISKLSKFFNLKYFVSICLVIVISEVSLFSFNYYSYKKDLNDINNIQIYNYQNELWLSNQYETIALLSLRDRVNFENHDNIFIKINYNTNEDYFPADINFTNKNLDFFNILLAVYLSDLNYNIYITYYEDENIANISGVGLNDNREHNFLILKNNKNKKYSIRKFKNYYNNNKNIFIYYNDQSVNNFLNNSEGNDFFLEVKGNY